MGRDRIERALSQQGEGTEYLSGGETGHCKTQKVG